MAPPGAGPVTAELGEAVAAARAAYAHANPISGARHQRACAVMPGGNTRTVLFHEPFPLRIAGGDGCRVTDADGHTYVDFLGEFTAGLFGHSHPVIRTAVVRALDAGVNLSGHNLAEQRLAELLCARFPSIDLVRFTNSGTEANLLALATATHATGRRKVVVFDGGYHGSLLSFVGGGSPVNVPHDFVVCPYNDVAATQRVFDEHGASLAAVLVEPMIGSGGCIPADLAFLRAVREGAASSGAILIFDEVMTSRLAPGGLQEQTGVVPDMTTLGKYIGGGMSFGAFGGRAELMAAFDPRRPDALPHAGTFNNNVVSMSAGVAAMSEVATPEALTALNERGDRLRARLADVCRRRGVPVQVTGIGSLANLHPTDRRLRTAGDAAAVDPRLRELLFFGLLRRGVLIAKRGFVALSLEIGEPECDAFVAAFDDVVTELDAMVSERGGPR